MIALTVVKRGLLQGPVLRGARDGFVVEATRRRALPFGPLRFVWSVDVRFVSLCVRTALRLWPRGPSFAAALQGTNVTTGDPDVDERFLLWGSEPDLTRAIIEDPYVKVALDKLYRAALLHEIALHPLGNLEVRFRCDEDQSSDPAVLVDGCVSFARALEDAADAAPLERRLLDRHGVGGASGAPIGVPSSP